MKYIIAIIGIFLSAYSFGQYPVIEKIAQEICDTLNNTQVENPSEIEAKGFVGLVILKNKTD